MPPLARLPAVISMIADDGGLLPLRSFWLPPAVTMIPDDHGLRRRARFGWRARGDGRGNGEGGYGGANDNVESFASDHDMRPLIATGSSANFAKPPSDGNSTQP